VGQSGNASVKVGSSVLNANGLNAVTDKTAGTTFNTSIAALDQCRNVDANNAGLKCLEFTGPDNAPGRTAPYFPVRVSYADATASAVSFGSGWANGPNLVSFTSFDVETVDLTVSLDGVQRPVQRPLPSQARQSLGSGRRSSPKMPPPLARTGAIGSLVRTSIGQNDAADNIYDASLQVKNAYGNLAANALGGPLLIDVAFSGIGVAAPVGSAGLTVLSNQSVAATPFTPSEPANRSS